MEKDRGRRPHRERALEWTSKNLATAKRKGLQREGMTMGVDADLVDLLIARQRVLVRANDYREKVRRIDERNVTFLINFLNDPQGHRNNMNLFQRIFEKISAEVEELTQQKYQSPNEKHRAYTWGLAITNLASVTNVLDGGIDKEVVVAWRDRWTPRINEAPYSTSPPLIS